MDLSRVMNAYRGQEDKLKQRVQLSNDLLELIAYEQLTREKRQLMAAQQAQSGPPPDAPTIKEQKEKEALELTKQQLAQQIGGGLQQKAMQQQQAMRQGIASAPGAQSAMPPQAMAAGGIVAFDDGGVVNFQAGGRSIAEQRQSEEERRARLPGESLRDYMARMRELEKQLAIERQSVVMTPEERAKREGAPITPPSATLPRSAPVSPGESIDRTLMQMPSPGEDIDRTMMQVPPEETPERTAAPATPAASPVPVQTGIPQAEKTGILAAMPSAPDNRMLDRLTTQMGAALGDARAQRANPLLQELTGLRGQLEQYAKEFPKESEESKRARAADQAALEARYAKMSDPQTQMLDRLQAFLAGGAGRRGLGSVLGGAGEAESRVRVQQEAQGLQALKDIQKGREEMRQRDVAEAREAYGVRGKTLELGTKIAETASKIEAETNISDQRIAASLAETGIRAVAAYAGDMEKIKAELAKHAATLRYNITNDELNRIAQIAVAEVGAGARSDAATQSKIASLTNQRATQLNDILTKEEKAKEDPMLKQAYNAAPNKRTPAQQKLINDHERKWAEERANLIGPIDEELKRLRGQASAGATAPTGSAAAQGVRVTGATPTR